MEKLLGEVEVTFEEFWRSDRYFFGIEQGFGCFWPTKQSWFGELVV